MINKTTKKAQTEKTYTYDQFRKKFMPRCLGHCFCRKMMTDAGRMRRECCHCGERENG